MANKPNDQSRGDMSVREAGKKGGETTASTHDREFYQDIGRKGGETRREELGAEGYSELGHKRGQRVGGLVDKGKRAQGSTGSDEEQ